MTFTTSFIVFCILVALGTVSAVVVWQDVVHISDKTYSINDHIDVKPGTVVKFSPGTSVVLKSGKYIRALGEEAAKIVFEPLDESTTWEGFVLSNSNVGSIFVDSSNVSETSTLFRHCIFRKATDGIFLGGSNSLKVEDSEFIDNGSGISAIGGNGRLLLTNVKFTGSFSKSMIDITGFNYDLQVKQSTFSASVPGSGIKSQATNGAVVIEDSIIESPVAVTMSQESSFSMSGSTISDSVNISGGKGVSIVSNEFTTSKSTNLTHILSISSTKEVAVSGNDFSGPVNCISSEGCLLFDITGGTSFSFDSNNVTSIKDSPLLLNVKATCQSSLNIATNNFQDVQSETMFSFGLEDRDCITGSFSNNKVKSSNVTTLLDMSKAYDFSVNDNEFAVDPTYYVVASSSVGQQNLKNNYWNTDDANQIREKMVEVFSSSELAFIDISPYKKSDGAIADEESLNIIHGLMVLTTISFDKPVIIAEDGIVSVEVDSALSFQSDTIGFIVIGSFVLQNATVENGFIWYKQSASLAEDTTAAGSYIHNAELYRLSVRNDNAAQLVVSSTKSVSAKFLGNVKLLSMHISDCDTCVLASDVFIQDSEIYSSNIGLKVENGGEITLKSCRIEAPSALHIDKVSSIYAEDVIFDGETVFAGIVTQLEIVQSTFVSEMAHFRFTDQMVGVSRIEFNKFLSGSSANITVQNSCGNYVVDVLNNLFENEITTKFVSVEEVDTNQIGTVSSCFINIHQNRFNNGSIEVHGEPSLSITDNIFIYDVVMPTLVSFSTVAIEQSRAVQCYGNYANGQTIVTRAVTLLSGDKNSGKSLYCEIGFLRTGASFDDDYEIYWDTEWTVQERPYYIQKNLTANAVLTIMEGVSVAFGSNVEFVLHKKIVTAGTAANPILFKALDQVGYKMIKLSSSIESTIVQGDNIYESGSILKNVHISGVCKEIESDECGVVVEAEVLLENVIIKDSGKKSLSTTASPLLTRCEIYSGEVNLHITRTDVYNQISRVLYSKFVNLPKLSYYAINRLYFMAFQYNTVENCGELRFEINSGGVVITQNTITGAGDIITNIYSQATASFESNTLRNTTGVVSFKIEHMVENMKILNNDIRNSKATSRNTFKFEMVDCTSFLIDSNYFQDLIMDVDQPYFTFQRSGETNCESTQKFEFKRNLLENIVAYSSGTTYLFDVNLVAHLNNNDIHNVDVDWFFLGDRSTTVFATDNWWGTTNYYSIASKLRSAGTIQINYEPILQQRPIGHEVYFSSYMSSSDVPSNSEHASGFEAFSSNSYSNLDLSGIQSINQDISSLPLDSATGETLSGGTFEPQFSMIIGTTSDGIALHSQDPSFPAISSEVHEQSTLETSTGNEITAVDTSNHPRLQVTVTRNSNPCVNLILRAEHQSDEPVQNILYQWVLFREGIEVFSKTGSENQVEINIGLFAPGEFAYSVTVTGYISSAFVSSEVLEQFSKFADRLGHSCEGTIAIKTSFEGQNSVPRNGKIVISPSISGVDNLDYLWIVRAESNRRIAIDASKYMITAPNAPALALYSNDGLPGDTTFFITVTISQGGIIIYNNQMDIQTAPTITIIEGFFGVSSDYTGESNIDGYSLSTMFTLSAPGWSASIPLQYTYSFYDFVSGKVIDLLTTDAISVSVILPAGDKRDLILPMYLTVATTWGDKVTTSRNIKVAPIEVELDTLSTLSGLILQQNSSQFVSNALTVTSFINQQSKSGSRNDQAYRSILQSFYSKLEAIALSGLSDRSENEIQQYVALVGLITKLSDLTSADTKISSMLFVDKIMQRYTTSANETQLQLRISKATTENIAEVISNVVESGMLNSSLSHSVMHTANKLAQTVILQTVPSEELLTIKKDNFQMALQLDRIDTLSNSTIEMSKSSTISIPSTFASEVISSASQIVSVVALSFKNNPYVSINSASSKNVASGVVDVTFYLENSTKLEVRDLSEPLVIQIEKPDRCDLSGDYAEFGCKYWDEELQVWSDQGCSWVRETSSTTSVSCHCNHTTSFSAFILHKGKCPKKAPGMSVTGIAFNAVYIVLCVGVMFIMFVCRNSQPLASRFIAPYIGICAIIVDALLQGIVNNSLSFAGKWDMMDVFSYIIMLIANPLSIAALFVYLWQQIRFVLMQNIYYLMSKKKLPIVVFACRVMTSKLVFVCATIGVGGFVLAYFAALVGIAASRVNEIQTDRIIAIQSTTYAAFALLLTIGICLTIAVDIAISMRRISKEKTSVMSPSEVTSESSDDSMQYEQKRGISVVLAHIHRDALHFRAEAALLVMSLVFILILYPIGMRTVFKNSAAKAPDSIARYIIEILLMLSKIVAFGGYIAVVTLYKRLKMRTDYSLLLLGEDEEKQDKLSEFNDLLRDNVGMKLLTEYCVQEFSLENVLLFKELEEIRTTNLIMSTEERKSTLERMYATYIANNAERQLNCESKVKRKFESTMSKDVLSAVDAEELFHMLHSAVMFNLGDTFSRFVGTREYHQYMQAKIVHKELQNALSDHS